MDAIAFLMFMGLERISYVALLFLSQTFWRQCISYDLLLEGGIEIGLPTLCSPRIQRNAMLGFHYKVKDGSKASLLVLFNSPAYHWIKAKRIVICTNNQEGAPRWSSSMMGVKVNCLAIVYHDLSQLQLEVFTIPLVQLSSVWWILICWLHFLVHKNANMNLNRIKRFLLTWIDKQSTGSY